MVPGAAKGAGKSFVRLLSYMKRYWMQLILVFVCILVSAVAGVAVPMFPADRNSGFALHGHC